MTPNEKINYERQIERLKNYWAQRAQGIALCTRDELDGPEGAIWSARITNHRHPKDLKVLDVGAGAGFLAVLCATLGGKVTAVDVSPEMLRVLEENAAWKGVEVETVVAPADELPFEDETFDMVVCRNALWLQPRPDEALAEWTRVLKPGGMIMYEDGCYYNHLFDSRYALAAHNVPRMRGHAEKYMGNVDASVMERVAHDLPLSRCDRPGWDEEHLRSVGGLFRVAVRSMTSISTALTKRYEDIENSPRLPYSFFITAQKRGPDDIFFTRENEFSVISSQESMDKLLESPFVLLRRRGRDEDAPLWDDPSNVFLVDSLTPEDWDDFEGDELTEPKRKKRTAPEDERRALSENAKTEKKKVNIGAAHEKSTSDERSEKLAKFGKDESREPSRAARVAIAAAQRAAKRAGRPPRRIAALHSGILGRPGPVVPKKPLTEAQRVGAVAYEAAMAAIAAGVDSVRPDGSPAGDAQTSVGYSSPIRKKESASGAAGTKGTVLTGRPGGTMAGLGVATPGQFGRFGQYGTAQKPAAPTPQPVEETQAVIVRRSSRSQKDFDDDPDDAPNFHHPRKGS